MRIEKSTIYGILIFLVIVLVGYFFLKSNNTVNGNVINTDSNGEVQKVTLSIKNYNYYPNTITVKSGTPVRIYLDNTVTGCLRSFTIKDLGIAKNLPKPNDYVEFTPNKKGTYRFDCSMGMGTGTLIVE